MTFSWGEVDKKKGGGVEREQERVTGFPFRKKKALCSERRRCPTRSGSPLCQTERKIQWRGHETDGRTEHLQTFNREPLLADSFILIIFTLRKPRGISGARVAAAAAASTAP